MKARDADGAEAEIEDPHGEPARPPRRRRKPLAPSEVRSLQESIARGLKERGYRPIHVGQILNQPGRTASRRATPEQGRRPAGT